MKASTIHHTLFSIVIAGLTHNLYRPYIIHHNRIFVKPSEQKGKEFVFYIKLLRFA